MSSLWKAHEPICLQGKSSVLDKSKTFKPAFMEPRADKKQKPAELPRFPGERVKPAPRYRAPAPGSSESIINEMNKIYAEEFLNSKSFQKYRSKIVEFEQQLRSMDAVYEAQYPDRMFIIREADARLRKACEGLTDNIDPEQMILRPSFQNQYAKEITDILLETFLKFRVDPEDYTQADITKLVTDPEMDDDQVTAMVSARLDLIINCYRVGQFYRYQEQVDMRSFMLEGKRDREQAGVRTKRQKITFTSGQVPEYKVYQAIDHVTNFATTLQLSGGMPERMPIMDIETGEMKIITGRQREEFYYLKARSALASQYDFPIPNVFQEAGLERSMLGESSLNAKRRDPEVDEFSDDEDLPLPSPPREVKLPEPSPRRAPQNVKVPQAPLPKGEYGWGRSSPRDIDFANWHATIATENGTIFSQFEKLGLSTFNDVEPSRKIFVDKNTKRETIVYDVKTEKLLADDASNQSSERLLQAIDEVIEVRQENYDQIVKGWLKLERIFKLKTAKLNALRSQPGAELPKLRKKLNKLRTVQIQLTQFTNAKLGTEAYIEKLKEHRKDLYRKLGKLGKYMGSIPWAGGLLSVALSTSGWYTFAKLPGHFKELHAKVTQYRAVNGKQSESYLLTSILFGSMIVTQYAILPFLASAFKRIIQSSNVDREGLDETLQKGVERLRTSAKRVEEQVAATGESMKSSAETVIEMMQNADEKFKETMKQQVEDLNLFSQTATSADFKGMTREQVLHRFVLTGHIKAIAQTNQSEAYQKIMEKHFQSAFNDVGVPVVQGSFTSPAAVEGYGDLLGGATRVDNLFNKVVEDQVCNVSVSNAITGEFMSTTCSSALPGLLAEPQSLTVQHTLPGATSAVKNIAEAAERLRVKPETLVGMKISEKTTATMTVLESTGSNFQLPTGGFGKIPAPPISLKPMATVTRQQVLDALSTMPDVASPFGSTTMTDEQKRIYVQVLLSLKNGNVSDDTLRTMATYGRGRLDEQADSIEHLTELVLKLRQESIEQLRGDLSKLGMIKQDLTNISKPMNDILDKLANELSIDTVSYPTAQLTPKSAALFERLLKKRMLEKMDERFTEDFAFLPESPTKISDMINWFSRLHPESVDQVVNETIQQWTVIGGQDLHMKEMAPYLVSRHFLLPDGTFSNEAIEALRKQNAMWTMLGHLKYFHFWALSAMVRYFEYSGLGIWTALMTPESIVTYGLTRMIRALRETYDNFKTKRAQAKDYKDRQAWRATVAALREERKTLNTRDAAERIEAIDAEIKVLLDRIGTKYDDQDAATHALKKFHDDFDSIIKADTQRLERACTTTGQLLGAAVKTMMEINKDMQASLFIASCLPGLSWYATIFTSLYAAMMNLLSFGSSAVGLFTTAGTLPFGVVLQGAMVIVGGAATVSALFFSYYVWSRLNVTALAIAAFESAQSVVAGLEKAVSIWSFLKSIYGLTELGMAAVSYSPNPLFKENLDKFFHPKPVFMVEKLMESAKNNAATFASEVNQHMKNYAGFDATTFAPEFKQRLMQLHSQAPIGDYVEGMLRTMYQYSGIESGISKFQQYAALTGKTFDTELRYFTPVASQLMADLTGQCTTEGQFIYKAMDFLNANFDAVGQILTTLNESVDPETVQLISRSLLVTGAGGYLILKDKLLKDRSKAQRAAEASLANMPIFDGEGSDVVEVEPPKKAPIPRRRIVLPPAPDELEPKSSVPVRPQPTQPERVKRPPARRRLLDDSEY